MMSAKPGFRRRRAGQQGYALLLVIFLATMLLVFATMAAPNVKTEGQREKEKELIWRGRQYARAVKLYYRKTGRFPTSLDDLTKPKIGSLRFLRQAYKDPMNAPDGSWRLIYVGPGGQLIGSLKPHPVNVQFGQVPGIGTPAAALAGPSAPNSGFGSTFGQPVGGPNPQGATAASGSSSGNPPATTGNPVSADQGTDSTAQGDAAIPSGDTPTIVGGNIIGVASKINKTSVIVYDHAKNYRLFEFIWDPSKDVFGMGQAGMPTGNGPGPGQPIGPTGPPPGQPVPPQPQPQQ